MKILFADRQAAGLASGWIGRRTGDRIGIHSASRILFPSPESLLYLKFTLGFIPD